MTDCALPECSRPPTSVLRLLPRRDVPPICDVIRRACAWPGRAEPISMHVCDYHRSDVAKVAHVVLSETPLGDKTATRIVKPDPETEARP